MKGMRSLTKKDLHELIDEVFKNYADQDVVASLFYCADGYHGKQSQCILLYKDVDVK